MTQSADSSWKRLYKAGGMSFMLSGVLFFAVLIAFSAGPTGAFGGSGESTLKFIAANRSFYILTNGLVGLGVLFLIPGVLALYFALEDLEKSFALLGVGFLLLFLTSLVSLSAGALVNLSDKYAASTTDAQRTIFSAAAEAVNSQSNTVGVVSYAVGLIILSILMLKGIFHKGIGYLGIATGLLVLLQFVPGLGFLFFIFEILGAIWFIAVGYRLYRLGR